MKQLLMLAISLFVTMMANAQEVGETAKPLTIGQIKTLKSNILKEDRVLNIYLPKGYDSTKTYPVIYLLDGGLDEDFLHIVGLVQFFNLQSKMPDFIIVGIVNVDRKRDFTFPTELKDLQKDFPTTGHSEPFIQFLADELQPFINKTYKTNATRYLIGQSLGGLLATEILLKHTQLFSHYLIVSPSLWWDDESLLKKAKQLAQKLNDNPLYIYISVGGKEDKIMQREAKNLASVLKKAQKKNIKIDFYPMPKEDHASILHRSIYEAFLKIKH